MKRTVLLSTIVLAGVLSFPATASAGGRWGFGFGFGHGGFHAGASYRNRHHRHGHRYRHHYRHHGHRRGHVHVRVPVYSRVWVEPVYTTVVSGYDNCGYPIHRSVVTRRGYYHKQITGYRCRRCNVFLR